MAPLRRRRARFWRTVFALLWAHRKDLLAPTPSVRPSLFETSAFCRLLFRNARLFIILFVRNLGGFLHNTGRVRSQFCLRPFISNSTGNPSLCWLGGGFRGARIVNKQFVNKLAFPICHFACSAPFCYAVLLGQKSCRTKVPQIFQIFVPNFAPNFAPNFLRSFRASFHGKRRPEKIHQKSPPFFNGKFPGKYEK